jgi:hypothetical protein|nr:MAG TPA: regulatory protein [Bacteriophage sp.]
MARRRRSADSTDENQISLFDMIEEINPGKFDAPEYAPETKPLGLRLKEAIAEAIKGSGLKRYAIAGQMSEMLGVEITESMLNAYTAESKEGYRMPAEYLPTFCRIVQDYTVLEILVSAAGGRMVKSEEIYYLEMGRLRAVEEAARKKRAVLAKECRQVRRK